MPPELGNGKLVAEKEIPIAAYSGIREEELKNRVAAEYFGKYDCGRIPGNIDFCVSPKRRDPRQMTFIPEASILWAEAKNHPTDVHRMLAQLILTIRGIGRAACPHAVDDKTVDTVCRAIPAEKIVVFRFGADDAEIREFIRRNFTPGEGPALATSIDRNNFTFIYQKWRAEVMPHIDAPWDVLKQKYALYDRDFFLAEMNVDDNGTPEVVDDRPAEDFYITFDANDKKPYCIHRKNEDEFDITMSFGFKSDGLAAYSAFWRRYKRPPKREYWDFIVSRLDLLVPQDVRERKGAFFTPTIWVEKSQQFRCSCYKCRLHRLQRAGRPLSQWRRLLQRAGRPLSQWCRLLQRAGRPLSQWCRLLQRAGRPLSQWCRLLQRARRPLSETNIPQKSCYLGVPRQSKDGTLYYVTSKELGLKALEESRYISEARNCQMQLRHFMSRYPNGIDSVRLQSMFESIPESDKKARRPRFARECR